MTWTRAEYWERVKRRAASLGTDHCTGVPDFQWSIDCCDEHDLHFRTHRRIGGQPISKWRADWRLARCIMTRSPLAAIWLGWLSPTAWLFWLGVTAFGWSAWRGQHVYMARRETDQVP